MKLQIVYLSLATPWSYWAYEAISSDHLVREILLPSCPRYPPRGGIICRGSVLQASHCEQVQAAVLQPQPAGPAFWWTPVRFGSVQFSAVPLPTNTAAPTELLQPDAIKVVLNAPSSILKQSRGCALAPLWSAPLKRASADSSGGPWPVVYIPRSVLNSRGGRRGHRDGDVPAAFPCVTWMFMF